MTKDPMEPSDKEKLKKLLDEFGIDYTHTDKGWIEIELSSRTGCQNTEIDFGFDQYGKFISVGGYD